MPAASRPIVYNEELMAELARVEQGIKFVAQDDAQLVLLWRDMDLNSNGSVDLNEVTAYFKTRCVAALTLTLTPTPTPNPNPNPNLDRNFPAGTQHWWQPHH
jgi:hypothetical protein